MNDNDFYSKVSQAAYEKAEAELRATPGCACSARMRNAGTEYYEVWVETYGCPIHDEQQQEFDDARAEFWARRDSGICTCRYELWGINMGTEKFCIEERLEQYDPHCREHGEPDCLCHWGMAWGDWYIEYNNTDCPIHGGSDLT